MVADEIRALSEESAKAANNIQEILTWLTDTTGQISKEITAGTDAASASVELVGGLMDYFSNINDATDEASQIVDEEYKIIEHVKEHFGNIQQEIRDAGGNLRGKFCNHPEYHGHNHVAE